MPEPVAIALLYPELLGTYGDGGNAIVLAQRLRWRGIPAEVVDVTAGEPIPRGCQLYLMGGGEDAPQTLAARELRSGSALSDAVAGGAGVLAVCAGLQVLGRRFAGDDNRVHEGLGMLDCETHRDGGPRRVGEVVVTPDPSLDLPELSGYENHGGVTTLGATAQPLGKVVVGRGNDGGDGTEGIVSGRVVGTYLHGPVLARNPALADHLLASVLGPLDPIEEPEVEALRRERLQAARHPHLPHLNAGWPRLRSGWRRRLKGG
ncbi:MAG: glutamine amidotransferase [Actinomycetota bacterium]|nr:glutamine amidotransferase [Actinomycetota bacterium]